MALKRLSASKKSEPTSLDKAQQVIDEVCTDMAAFLKEKNKSYGNSALEPISIMPSTRGIDSLTQIDVRINDKLKRLMLGEEFPGDNDYDDLAGYFMLRLAAKRLAEG